MTAVKQCNRCELRFPNERELVWHLAHDHDRDAAQLAQALVASQSKRREQERRAHRAAVHAPARRATRRGPTA